MNAAPFLEIRQAIVTHLKADATVTALMASGSIYGERAPSSPAFPLSIMGEFEAGENGRITYGAVHVFSKSAFTDEVARIIEAMATSLDGAVLELSDLRRVNVSVPATRITHDPRDQSIWKATASIEALVARDCDDR